MNGELTKYNKRKKKLKEKKKEIPTIVTAKIPKECLIRCFIFISFSGENE